MTDATQQAACSAQHYEVCSADLPLSCPMPNARLWDAHPRVYLAITDTGHACCPYCGASYSLVDRAADQPNPI